MSELDSSKKDTTSKKQIFDCDVSIDKSSYFEVFSASLGKIMANQEACSDIVVKGRDWNLSIPKGTISFGDDSYPIQFIGSEILSSNSWLWGWAIKNQLPDSLTVEADRLKQLGESYGLEILTAPQFGLTENYNGHMLSIICSALNENNVCYYRGPHEGGAIFVEFYGVPDKVFEPISAKSFLNVASMALKQFSVDHRIFITSFLFQNETPYEWSGDTLNAVFSGGKAFKFTFEKVDKFWRMKEINGSI